MTAAEDAAEEVTTTAAATPTTTTRTTDDRRNTEAEAEHHDENDEYNTYSHDQILKQLYCDGCQKQQNPQYICSCCKSTYYCSKNCQLSHWKEGHKITCIDIDSEHMHPRSTGKGSVCGLCKTPQANIPIVLDCNHTFCLVCIRKHFVEEKKGGKEEEEGPPSSFCTCPLCQMRQPSKIKPYKGNVEEIPLVLAKEYLGMATDTMPFGENDIMSESEIRSELLENGLIECQKVIDAEQALQIAIQTPDLLPKETADYLYSDDDDDNSTTNLFLPPLSRDNWLDAHLCIIDLKIAKGELEEAKRDVENLAERDRDYLEHLRHCRLAEYSPEDSAEELARLEYWSGGLGAAPNRAVRIKLASGKVSQAMEDWRTAHATFMDVAEALRDVTVLSAQETALFFRSWASVLERFLFKAETLFIEKEAFKMLHDIFEDQVELLDKHFGYSDSAVKMRLGLLLRSINADRSALGVHREVASIWQSIGELAVARDALIPSLMYEAPWDDDNKAKNMQMLQEISGEIKREEERKKREEEFLVVWGEFLECMRLTEKAGSWKTVKAKDFDMFAGDSDDDDDDDSETGLGREETYLKVQQATDQVFSQLIDASETEVSDIAAEDRKRFTLLPLATSPDGIPEEETKKLLGREDYDYIKLTKDALKDYHGLDPAFQELVIRRVQELATGYRSRIMAKALKGCKRPIFETYLEQKAANRILWTADDDSLVIWYIARHKKVSKMMKMIDEADERSTRRLTTASEFLENATDMKIDSQTQKVGGDRIFLDPLSDTPLKVYDIPKDHLPKLKDPKWKPRLHLTKQEREIVESPVATLLLGRSGTGKTVCICERIARDRHIAETGKPFSQLFVARSKGICGVVKQLVGSEYDEVDQELRSVDYFTFQKLLQILSNALLDGAVFDPEQRIDFRRFKRDFPEILEVDIDPLLLWTQIRSFIKGSVEALLKDTKSLDEDEYLDEGIFSIARCRLTNSQRKIAYQAFLNYEAKKKKFGLWDDCDLVSALHLGLNRAKADGAFPPELQFDKVYVDEIQDYTQSEIALFFLMGQSGSLFLAGDPAQAVVEGVEFRFEEIRSVVYKLLPKNIQDDVEKRQRVVPRKPEKVTLNFRSHSGILNVAAEVLEIMFKAYPNSAPDLGKDCGVFLGPRPSLFDNISLDKLKELVAKIDGVYVLGHRDEDVERLKEILGDKHFVLSIRDSKGLEFNDVILVDFFSGLEHQIPWREMLRVDGFADVSSYATEYPEIETHLKHLYTAITRCKMRFCVAETCASEAGKGFMKWMSVQKNLASNRSVDEVEKMVKTRDEWITHGIDQATHAEDLEDDPDRAIDWLNRANISFENGDVPELQLKVQFHLESIRVRDKLYDGQEIDQEDVRVLLQNLAENGLLVEASKLCRESLHLFDTFTQDMLQQKLLPFFSSD